jgi:hypothetical protein
VAELQALSRLVRLSGEDYWRCPTVLPKGVPIRHTKAVENDNLFYCIAILGTFWAQRKIPAVSY